jgi:hypothetical protein
MVGCVVGELVAEDERKGASMTGMGWDEEGGRLFTDCVA